MKSKRLKESKLSSLCGAARMFRKIGEDQIWKSFRNTNHKLSNRSYIGVISSYLILGHLREAAEVVDQWKESKTTEFDASACLRIMNAFRDVGLEEKANDFQLLLVEKKCSLENEVTLLQLIGMHLPKRWDTWADMAAEVRKDDIKAVRVRWRLLLSYDWRVDSMTAGLGWIITRQGESLSFSGIMKQVHSPLMGEALAMRSAFLKCKELGIRQINLYGVVADILCFWTGFDSISLGWILREKNKAADMLAKQSLFVCVEHLALT
ncbi:hypothetical protein Bca52824_050721 [Brassica carinata]|uniref:RNase H type-1 domain-containing protein n=1 Tax=Brassica carinata TaxID=52824 RepID=A0A8X7UKQ9_BRACI|nr:hypothetical protein Bca52824_050721 [Brassica carinata]